MKKIMSILGTRPDLIRLSQVIKKLDVFFDHVFVHTGQNFDKYLHQSFFKDLNLRLPDYQLNLKEKKVGFVFIGMAFHLLLDYIEQWPISKRKDRISLAYDFLKFRKLKSIDEI